MKDIMLMVRECVKHPRRTSIWLPEQSKYVCPQSEDALRYYEAMAKDQMKTGEMLNPPLYEHFKLIFLTIFGGPLFFVVLCVVLTFASGKEPPPLFEKVIMSLFDLAKIGFGAVVGLIAGPKLQEQAKRISAEA
jgi:hypothetical protein